MNFCSNCGSSQLVFEVPEGDNRPRYICKDCHSIHYQNPNVVVGCIPVYENKILLCRRAIEPRKGYWNLPAGFLENGETVQDGAMREVWEEACAKVEIDRLFVVYNIIHVNQVYMIFLSQLSNLDFAAGPESIEVRLFDFDEIPFDELAFDSNRFALNCFLQNPNAEKVQISSYHRTF